MSDICAPYRVFTSPLVGEVDAVRRRVRGENLKKNPSPAALRAAASPTRGEAILFTFLIYSTIPFLKERVGVTAN
jgi:hypothetical protein